MTVIEFYIERDVEPTHAIMT